LSYWQSSIGPDSGTVKVSAGYFDNKGARRSGKVLDEMTGPKDGECNKPYCNAGKSSTWFPKDIEIPIWENNLQITFELTHTSTGARGHMGDVAFDDIRLDEGLCPSNKYNACQKPLRPKKKTFLKEVYTGNWKCINHKTGQPFNMTKPGLQLPQGSTCQVRCNTPKDMPTPREHGTLYCGVRGWYSKITDEHVLNELPIIPGAPNDGSRKDPDQFNLMPVCKMVRCQVPVAPANADYFRCNHAETLDYMPYGFQCELRCKPGYVNTGPTFSKCWNGGNVQGLYKIRL